MIPQSKDTCPETEKIVISLLKKKTLSNKFSTIRSLSKMTIQLSKRAIARVNKDLNEKQVNLLFIRYHYGDDLACRVEKYLNEH